MPDVVSAGLPAPAAGWFTARTGGVSAVPYDTGNLGTHVGDDPERVRVNRTRLAQRVGLTPDRLVLMDQVHGAEVAVVDGPVPSAVPSVDALVTTVPDLGLLVLAADCLPVLLADPSAGVVAVAHAGRKGLAAGVLQATMAAMAACGARPASTRAVIGPAACGRCYEVPDQLADEVAAAVPGARSSTAHGTASLDLTAGALLLLRRAGLAQVSAVGGCTLEQPSRWFSYRRAARTGRHGGLVRLT